MPGRFLLKTVGKKLLVSAGKKAINSSLRSNYVQAGIQSGKQVIGKKVKEVIAKKMTK